MATPAADAPLPPVPGTDADVRRVARYRWALAARAVVALAAWTALTEVSMWLAAFVVAGPVLAWGALPSARRIREDLARSAIEAAAAAYFLFIAGCLGALAGGVLLAWGLANENRNGWIGAVLLFALLFVDRAFLRAGRKLLRLAPLTPPGTA